MFKNEQLDKMKICFQLNLEFAEYIKICLLKLTFLFIVVLITSCNVSESCPHKNQACQDGKKVIPNLYVYKSEDISNYFAKSNFLETYRITKIRKNSIGNCLFVYQYNESDKEQSNNKYRVLKLCKGGSVDQLKTKTEKVEINDQGEIIAWFDEQKFLNLNDDYKILIPPFGRFQIDSTGKYFFITFSSENTKIFSVDNPEKPLAQLNFDGRNIFFYNDKIYLFGDDPYYRKITCNIFKRLSSEIKLESEISIIRPVSFQLPSPFVIEDFDPPTNRVLLVDVRDAPFNSKHYIYNLETKTMDQVYLPKDYDYAFFLEDNILEASEK